MSCYCGVPFIGRPEGHRRNQAATATVTGYDVGTPAQFGAHAARGRLSTGSADFVSVGSSSPTLPASTTIFALTQDNFRVVSQRYFFFVRVGL